MAGLHIFRELHKPVSVGSLRAIALATALSLAFGSLVLDSPAIAEDKDAVAVIIGNKGYVAPVPDVEFAHNDARNEEVRGRSAWLPRGKRHRSTRCNQGTDRIGLRHPGELSRKTVQLGAAWKISRRGLLFRPRGARATRRRRVSASGRRRPERGGTHGLFPRPLVRESIENRRQIDYRVRGRVFLRRFGGRNAGGRGSGIERSRYAELAA